MSTSKKYLLIGDIHLSDKPPSALTEDYCDDLITILEHTIQLESALNVDGVIWSGDVFHSKQANRNSHRLVQRAIDIVQAYKKLWIVPGNHDLAQNRFDSIYESQPLGVLFKAGAELLKGWEAAGEHPIYGVPWQSQWTQEAVTEAFRAWHGAPLPYSMLAKSLVVGHAPLYPPSLEPPWEYYPTGESRHGDDTRKSWSEIQQVGYCYYGHVHPRHGTYQVGNVIFCNNGAITRGSLHEEELKRAVVVTTWSAEEGFKEIPVPHRPASEIFKLMERREKEDKKADLSEFLDSVGSAQIEMTSLESVIAHIQSLDVSDDVMRLAVELLENAK